LSELVLIADDDRDIVRFVEVNLKLEGFRVATAHDGDDALAKALSLNPDIVLLDVMMPRMDGYEVCTRLRADQRGADTPVIMLTAKSLSADKVLGLTAGADDYIVKPFDPMELVARVRSTLARSKEKAGSEAQPATGLPRGSRIERELDSWLERGEPFSVAVIGLEHLAPYAECYGADAGAQLVELTASVLTRAAEDAAGSHCFVGQAGQDDFVVVLPASRAAEFARRAADGFDLRVPSLYEPEQAAAGRLEFADAQGRHRREPIACISIGLTTGVPDHHPEPSALLADASDQRDLAARRPGSSWSGI
jgi:PleD family two-component response regulator